ncbi:MAG TPA: penicillin-binding protein 2 [Candidatus Dojkabacteria bacterium]|jgi:cell division protein FtsI/penicillin-binding protein 2
MNEDRISLSKLRIISFGLIVGFLFVFAFLFRWQIVEAKRFEEMASERIRNVSIPSLRGSIYAKDSTTLAFQERRFDIFVYIPELERAEEYQKQTREEFISKVSNSLGQEETVLQKRLSGNSLWIKIADKLTNDEKENLLNQRSEANSERRLEGMFVEFTSERVYPENTLASQVVGFYADNGTGEKEGRAGIELYWENSLRPFEGSTLEQVDSFQNTIPILDFTPVDEKRGIDIYLTIDLQFQRIIEQKLKEGVERYEAEGGAIVLMDPKTGEIISMASYPTFDPNDLGASDNPLSFRNMATSVPYEFGSVGKIFTVAGAIDKGAVTPATMVLPEGHDGCEFYQDPNLRECQQNIAQCRVCTFDSLPQPPKDVAKSLVTSDNVGLYHIAEELGPEDFHAYLEAFRLNKPTGIEMYESTGYIRPLDEWNIADLVVHSYGHGYQSTLLEVVSGVSAIANDGKIMQPHIVSKIVEPDGSEKKIEPEVIAQPVKPETATLVAGILREAFTSGLYEHYYRDLAKYPVAVKSGTALIAYEDRVGYSDEINTTYVGFDISESKSFVMGVWLHKPKRGGLSSQNVRLVWNDTFREIKDYLDIEPDL